MRRLVGVAQALAIAGLFGCLAWWSWDTWADVLVDFGRELYVPWRITEGDVLYRDVAHLNGPLSQYFDALLLRLFGSHLLTLELANLVILALLVALNHALLRRVAGPLGAFGGSIAQVGMFSFQGLFVVGNFNWVAPYSHEVTHGIALATLAIWMWARWHEHGGTWPLVGLGIAGGAVLLTKPEVALALAAALAVAFCCSWFPRHSGRARRPLRKALLAGLVGATVVALAVGLLALAMPVSTALRGALGGLPQLFDPAVGSLFYYRLGLGLDQPLFRLEIIWGWTWRWAVYFGAAAALDRLIGKRVLVHPAVRALAFAVAGGIGFALLGLGDEPMDFRAALRPLPLALAAVLAVSLPRALRASRHAHGPADLLDSAPERAPLVPVLATFGLVLLAKMLLMVRLDQYGFALPMPGTILLVAQALGPMRLALARWRGSGVVWSGAVLGAVAAAIATLCMLTGGNFEKRPFVFGPPTDRLHADALRGACVYEIVGRLETTTPPHSTLAVVPEGVTLNWFLRRVNPTGFLNFMPPELMIFGEKRMIEAFERSPPDFIAVVQKYTPEYGMDFFGRDYGVELMAWIRRHYERKDLLGNPPLEDPTKYGIEILARKR